MSRITYCPELGETKPEGRLFDTSYSRAGYYAKWTDADNAKALETFKAMRIKPKWVRPFEAAYGPRKGLALWSANISETAHDKLAAAGLVALEVLLD